MWNFSLWKLLILDVAEMKTMIELCEISKQYKGKKVFENISLSFYEKQIVALWTKMVQEKALY